MTVIDLNAGRGRHRGDPGRLPGDEHCCFAGCDTRTCRTCGHPVCVREGLHDCRPPYVGRHRRDEALHAGRGWAPGG